MKRILVWNSLVILFSCISILANAQLIVLNEDFSSASGTNQPDDWGNFPLGANSAATDLWHFDNPGNRTLPFPFTGSFAIFDADAISDNGQSEVSVLESKAIDASAGANCVLTFDHFLQLTGGDSVFVDVRVGPNTYRLDTITASTTQPVGMIYNVSQWLAGITNGRIRFTWKGNGSGFWAIDNIQVNLPASLDAGITDITNPVSPFAEGSYPVRVNITNFGAQPINSALIGWSVDGVARPNVPVSFSQPLSYWQSNGTVSLGNVSFPAGVLVNIKAHIISVNNQADLNPNNNLESNLIAALCGTYTINQNDPQARFQSFEDASSTLVQAGVTCPVTFNVAPGFYEEAFSISQIPGASAVNTVTFQSASGDSSTVTVSNSNPSSSNNYTLNLAGTSHVRFRDLSIQRLNFDYVCINIQTETSDIVFENCALGSVRAPGTAKVDGLSFINNNMANSNISVGEHWYPATDENRSRNIVVSGNNVRFVELINIENSSIINNYRIYANDTLIDQIRVDNNNLNVIISDNRTKYIYIEGKEFHVANNLILSPHDNAMRGDGVINSTIEFNTLGKINPPTIENALMQIASTDDVIIKDNIFLGEGRYDGIFLYYQGDYNSDGELDNHIFHNSFVQTAGSGIYLNEMISTTIEKNEFTDLRNSIGIRLMRAKADIINNLIHMGGAGQGIGILLDSDIYTVNTNNGSRILHNNILVNTPDPLNGRGIVVRKGLNLDIQNNIFANTGGGYAGVFDENMSSSTISNNDYYTTGINLLKRNSIDYTTLAAYIAAFPQETGSVSVNPFYTAEDNLSPNQIALKDNAVILSDVPADFFGTQRGSTPDIGAVEFEPCAGDLAINRFIGLSNPLPVGPNQPITVELSNQGTNVITQAIISWQVNGVAQTPYTWNGNLQPEGTAVVQIGTFSFASGAIYDISASTSSDCNPFNSTCEAGIVGTPLCGVYYIGGNVTSNWFPTFGAAAQALNTFGIACSAVFYVRPGVYEEEVTFYQTAGASATNTILFIGESLDSTLVSLTTQSNNDLIYALTLSGANYITFRHIGIERMNSLPYAMLLTNNADHVRFENCKLGGVFKPENVSIFNVAFTNNNFGANKLVLGQYYSMTTSQNIDIIDNVIGNIEIYKVNGGRIINNASQDPNNTNNLEYRSYRTKDFLIKDNTLKFISSALDSTMLIENNEIVVTYTAHGISLGESQFVNVRNNTITANYNGVYNLISFYGVSNDTISNNTLNGNGVFGGIWHFNEYYLPGFNVVISDNIIENTQEQAILTHKTFAKIYNNKIRHFKNGLAIRNMRTFDKIYNNYIHCDGNTPAVGISLQTRVQEPDNVHSVEIYHNNVWIETTDNVNGIGLEISNGYNHIVKNNIFYNSAGGYAATFDYQSAESQLDYNNYYTAGSNFIRWDNSPISNISGLQSTSGQDLHSLSVNPNFTSEINLVPNQTLLNNIAPLLNGYNLDINGTIRPASCDLGAVEFIPCPSDRGLNSFIDLEDQIQVGIIPIRVELQNHGTTNLTSATVAWTVNGVAQNPFTWNGTITPGNNQTIQIGTYSFQQLTIYNLKAWITGSDCNIQNDTCRTNQIGIPLCGNYTIGGVASSANHFSNISNASYYLNNIGVSCPVTFNVRPGVYNDQIILNNAPGSSSTNTITFQGESNDATSVTLYYPNQSAAYPFTLGLFGAKHYIFQRLDLDVNPNGASAVRIEAYCENLTFRENNIQGLYNSGVIGDIEDIFIENNIMSNNSIFIGSEYTLGRTTNCRVVNNFVNSIFFDKGEDVLVEGNRYDSDINSSTWYSRFYRCRNLVIQNNRIRRTDIDNCHGIIYDNNYSDCLEYYNLYLVSSSDVEISNSYFEQSQSWSYSPNINGYNNTNCIIHNNVIDGNSIFPGITWVTEPWDFQSDTLFITDNLITNTKNFAINIFRYKNVIANNKILNFSSGNAIKVDAVQTDITNNYIHCSGESSASGITLPVRNLDYGPIYNYARIYHNSVNIVSTNAQFGRAIEVLDNYPANIRSNIFANEGGGFAAFINSDYSNLQLDYNCYYSTASNFGSYNGTLFNNLSSWGQAVGADANSIEFNPFFESDTELLPYQRQINGAGGPCNPPVLLDIDGEIRNQLAPDMGAQEFMIDFGITDLLSPTLDCYQSDDVPVTIALRQFGDIPFIDLQLAYQLNNGTVYTNQIPGAIDDDIEFTFNNLVDLSQEGTYLFKIWLVDNTDDNIFNDTLFIERFRKPAPVVNFTYNSACANSAVNFNGTASISQGSIVLTEWDFGDGEMAEGLNTAHIYDVSGTYDVTFRAFSNEGCYSETQQEVSLLPTPDVTFSWQGSCVNSNVVFTNGTTLPTGTGSVTYAWNFGDGTTSTLETPVHQYTTSGTYTVALTVANQNGCADTYTATVDIYDLPLVSFTLPATYDLNLASITLEGTPPGGIFSGPGVIGNVFAPALAGIGNHTIVYEHTNGATGCSATATQTINVFNSLCVDPEITSQPATITEACLNTSGISVSVTASGAQLNYQWYQASSLIAVGSPIPNAISAQYEPSTAALGTTYYYCRISFPNGCYAVSERGAFEVLPVETPTFAAFPSYCQGDSPAALPLQSTNGYEGTWSPAAVNTANPGISVYTFIPNTGECASSLDLNIEVTPATVPTFNVALSYCVGDQINALPTTSTNNISGSWAPSINNQTTTTYTFTPDANQCALPTTLVIDILPIETPLFDPIGSLCSGQTAPVLFNQSNNGINGSWSPSVISNTASDFYTFTPAVGECANSVTLFVEVNPLPQATISGGTSVCTGENATVQFSGTPNATVSYSRDNGPVQFVTLNNAGTASVSTGFLLNNTTYTLINAATQNCLATLNGSTSFTVVPASNAGIGSSLFLCNDVTEIDLFDALSGSPTPNGTWNGPSTLANGFLGTFDSAIHQTGAYTYAVPGAANCPPSTATIFVNISNGPSTSISYNGPFCTSLTGSQLPQITGSFGGTFNAYPSGLNITPAGGITPSTSSPGSYLVVYTPLAGTGCSGGTISTIVEITSPPVANIAAGGPLAFCEGNDVVLTATPGSSYLWSNGETSQSITTSIEDSYTVTVFNGTSCSAVSNTLNVNVLPVPGDQILASGNTTFCSGGSVTLTASPGESYLWNTDATNPSITVNQDGVYQVEVTNAFDCSTLSEAAVIDVLIPTQPLITPSGTISICSDESATLTASGAISYLWNTGSAANTINVVNAGSYTVTGTDAQGCEAISNPVQVIVSPVPTPIVTIVGGTTFCSGSSTTLTAAGADSYLWSNGEQTQSITVGTTGVYSVTLFTGNNCSATSSEITISVADSFTFFRDDDGDGFGDSFDTLSGCVIPPGYSLNGGDCNDSNSSISPIAQEICDDGIDNNCLMGIDENCEGAGCIDPLACNYDSLAVSPDGSCTYPGCNDPSACNYNPLAGCLDEGSCITGGCDDPTACNFNVSALCNDGSCTYEGCMDTLALNYNPQAGCDDGSCLYIQGCMDSAACNYNPQATQDNGDCTYPGCASELACNFDPAAGCDDGSCSYPGCTDSNAFNFDPEAGCNDGSCFYVEGCTDSTACNFNEDAGINDGSCTFPGCMDVNACNYNANAGCAGGLCYYMNMGNIDGNTIVATDSIYSYSYTCDPGCIADFSMTPLLGLITPIDECSVEIIWSSEVNDFAELTATITCDNGCTGEENLTILVSAMEEISNAGISAYPNPTTHDFVLSLDAALFGSSIDVYNALGMHVFSSLVSDLNTTIESSDWPAGIYTLQVSNENNRYTLQVVKQ